MDLSTISAKLDSGKYKERAEFEGDFHLMIQNAKTYNAAGSYAHSEALALESFFDKRSSFLLLRYFIFNVFIL